MHKRVNILQYVKTPSGLWQWAPIPKNPRTGTWLWGKLQSDSLYIAWREHGRRHYEKAGSTPAEALEAQRRKEFELIGLAVSGRRRKPGQSHDTGLILDVAIAHYLEFLQKKRRPNTLKRYRVALRHLQQFFRPGTPVAEITPADIDAFRDERLTQKNPWGRDITPRNVNSEVAMVRAFFYYLQRFVDPETPNPAARLKPLKVTLPVVDSYHEKELEAFFDATTQEERAIFKTFYYTGLREQELAHLHWSDIDLDRGLLIVRARPAEGFIPKDWEEREVPLHDELIEILRQLPERKPGTVLFPTFNGRPNGHLLRLLQTVVKRAGLTGRWYLHKFRKTFATLTLEKGADIHTVQTLLGHKNITTTARYLSTTTEKMRSAVRRL